jgi:hypothetical protein
MVKLKFIIRDDVLVLRISEVKQRYYKTVKPLLKGNPNIERHWNNDKERFTSYAVSCTENNQILDDFKEFYRSLISFRFFTKPASGKRNFPLSIRYFRPLNYLYVVKHNYFCLSYIKTL